MKTFSSPAARQRPRDPPGRMRIHHTSPAGCNGNQPGELSCGRLSLSRGRGVFDNHELETWVLLEVLAGDHIPATAFLDRLLHNSDGLDIRRSSYRLRDLEETISRQGN